MIWRKEILNILIHTSVVPKNAGLAKRIPIAVPSATESINILIKLNSKLASKLLLSVFGDDTVNLDRPCGNTFTIYICQIQTTFNINNSSPLENFLSKLCRDSEFHFARIAISYWITVFAINSFGAMKNGNTNSRDDDIIFNVFVHLVLGENDNKERIFQLLKIENIK